MSEVSHPISTIAIPTRVQNDTAAAIFILKKFGTTQFPGIEKARVILLSNLAAGETGDTLLAKGTLAIDIGGGMFDHHNKGEQVTATDLICRYLGLEDNPALEKLRSYVQRCDFFGKAIISNDPLDRAFGLAGLLVNLNKKYNSEPEPVLAITTPLFDAHYLEEERRTIGMPKEVEEKMKSGEAEIFSVKQYDKKLNCIYIASENMSLPGYLRSQLGGRYDVVALQLPSGHINILTRPTKHIDLRHTAAVIRRAELMKKGDTRLLTYKVLSQTGRVNDIPEWYYDQATNSIQNGGINPGQTAVTKLSRAQMIKLLEIGLGDQSA